jgi:hypothetical protein
VWVWTVEEVMIDEIFSTTLELDALAAEACDTMVRMVNDPAETYIHVRRDGFVF